MTTLEAIDRLNSWVRSDSARSWHDGPRWAIYDWKHEAIGRAINEGKCQYRAIYLTLRCRDCGGSGRYTDSSGWKHDHCWKCNSSGKTRLTFLETTIGGFRWHTPEQKAWRFRLQDDAYTKATLSTDWEPNAKGRDLTLPEVCECLNVLEVAMPSIPGSHGMYDHGDWYGDHDHKKYRIFLGYSERICELCGRDAVPKGEHGFYDGIHHHVSRDHVEWCAWACCACKGLYATMNRWCDVAQKYVPSGGNGKNIFDEFCMPVEPCQHPEVRQWLERRAWLDAARKGGRAK